MHFETVYFKTVRFKALHLKTEKCGFNMQYAISAGHRSTNQCKMCRTEHCNVSNITLYGIVYIAFPIPLYETTGPLKNTKLIFLKPRFSSSAILYYIFCIFLCLFLCQAQMDMHFRSLKTEGRCGFGQNW